MKTAYVLLIRYWSSDVCSSDLTDGSINLEAWLDHAVSIDTALDREVLKEACEFAREAEQQHNAAKNLWSEGTSSFQTGLEIAEILADLKLDQDSLVAAVLYRGVREGQIQLPVVSQRFGTVVAQQIGRSSCRDRVGQDG